MLEQKFRDIILDLLSALPVCTLGKCATTILVVVVLWGISVFLVFAGILLVLLLGVFVLIER